MVVVVVIIRVGGGEKSAAYGAAEDLIHCSCWPCCCCGGGLLQAFIQKHRQAPDGPRPIAEVTVWSFFSQCADVSVGHT